MVPKAAHEKSVEKPAVEKAPTEKPKIGKNLHKDSTSAAIDKKKRSKNSRKWLKRPRTTKIRHHFS
ncbi:hypothetical protein CASFOL_042513 [Castilleja foliolosa]|uniref:Uncharacterized protein n=1 Tax=Castilleja foliolosa TaxID=1961234 RepID=A0ABD3BAY8_9LAMI